MATGAARPRRVLFRSLSLTRQRATVAVEFTGEWLKVAHVAATAKGKKLLKLFARKLPHQDELSTLLLDLVKGGLIPPHPVLVVIPRNLVTVRNLRLPTTDHHELKEMVALQAAKHAPYSNDELITDFQVIRSSPERYTDGVLVTTNRSVSNRCLRALSDARIKAEGVRLSSQGVLTSYRLIRERMKADENGPVAVVDIDSSFSDFMVVFNGQITLTKALSVGPAKRPEGRANEVEKFTEEIARAVDIYENEQTGQKITRLVIMGADIDIPDLIPRLTEQLRLPVERISLLDHIPAAPDALNLPAACKESLSFAAVVGLAWSPERAKIDLTPQEIRIQDALESKGRAITVTGILLISIFTALSGLISQHIYFKKQYLDQLQREIHRTQQEANHVEAMKKRLKMVRDATQQRHSPLEILSVLYRSTPPDIHLKAITVQEGSYVVLKGVSPKMSTVFEFLATLEKLPNFHNVKAKHATRAGSKDGTDETEFEITCPLTKGHEA